MTVYVFDVEHGECVLAVSPTGRTVLMGVGHNSLTGWRPSALFRKLGIKPTTIVLTNFDRDHMSDIHNFTEDIRPQYLMRNKHLNTDHIIRIKQLESGMVHPGVTMAAHWSKNIYTGRPIAPNYGMTVKHFYHPTTLFHPSQSGGLNNLSAVTYIESGGIGLLNPSDMQKEGIEALLTNPDFIDCLSRTYILIAPHHGRENGFTPQLFRYFNPQIVVVSDKSIVHETQAHNLYPPHVTGLVDSQGRRRKILSTRRDGLVTVEVTAPGLYNVNMEK